MMFRNVVFNLNLLPHSRCSLSRISLLSLAKTLRPRDDYLKVLRSSISFLLFS
ncbi:hypothetical protein Fmac_026846 [Flemingia macrophylla]|uniref:Uncharacterized protein n=1 Tax=Flemingia macrophylla TaxID=520843 RepID=A0ABD1LFZ7_9FABA